MSLSPLAIEQQPEFDGQPYEMTERVAGKRK